MTVALQKLPPPLHVALPGRLAEEVRRIALLRGDHPQTLVAAAMQKLVDGGMDELMGAAPAVAHAPGHGVRALDAFPAGLTQRQCGVLYVLGFHADDDGVFRQPLKAIGLILNGLDMPGAGDVLAALNRKGLIADVPGRDGLRHWQLTRAGRRVFKELSEEVA